MVAGGAEGGGQPHWAGRLLRPAGRSRPVSTTSPTEGSRPYDKDRDGFVMGEGAGVVVLEDYEQAKARGARIYGELSAMGCGAMRYHITAPSEGGDGGYPLHERRRSSAPASSPADIDYINAHGTSTPLGDEIELGSVTRLLGDARGRGRDVVDQVGDRASARRGGIGRGDLLAAGHPRQCRAADAQSRQPVGRDADQSGAEGTGEDSRSMSPSPTPSALAAPMPR